MTESHAPATFETYGLSASLLKALAEMNIEAPTEIQRETLPTALEGSDLIGIAQTGSGKTLAYALAAIHRLEANPKARTLILTPTKETAEQIFNVVSKLCVEAKISIGLAVAGPPLVKQANELKKNPRVIVATPGRLFDQLKNNKLLLQGLAILVVDEADRMLDLGFGDQLKFIQSTLRGDRQTMMFAATFGKWAELLAVDFMKPEAKTIRASAVGAPVATLTQKIYFMTASQKEYRLVDELKNRKGGVILFGESQESCVKIGRFLEYHGFNSEFIHGNMNPGHRGRVLREFREQKIQIMVTTDVMARGLDIPAIECVISYDLPYRGEEYLHRIGRTARAGREGLAITFVTPSDGRTFRRMKDYVVGAQEEYLTSNFKFLERATSPSKPASDKD